MKNISEIKDEFNSCPPNEWKERIEVYSGDDRSGVQKLLSSYQKKIENHQKELLRLEKMHEFENKYSDFTYICGIDEAGSGPLAGPVVAGAVILPKACVILHLNDSKQLIAKRRA